jgi:hypothetical protein
MNGRLEKCEILQIAMCNPNHRNCFFQCLHNIGRTFSFIQISFFNINKKDSKAIISPFPFESNTTIIGDDYFE